MTQTRLPLFGTGIPQIVPLDVAFPVPLTDLEVLDLRGDPTNQQSRLVTLWAHASTLNPVAGVDQLVVVWIQQGTDPQIGLQVSAVFQSGAPFKILDNFLLRGDVRLSVSSPDTNLVTGDVPVVWGYYTLEGEAPRSAFELRPLQPTPGSIPLTMGQPDGFLTPPALVPGPGPDPTPAPTPIDRAIHMVSDTSIDEIRLETYVLLLNDPNLIRALLYFDGTPITAPLVLGPGFISLTSPLTSPVVPTNALSAVRRYLDSIPFTQAGALRLYYEVIPTAVPPDDVYAPTIFSLMGSFLRS